MRRSGTSVVCQSFGVRMRQSLSGVRIFDHPHLIPDEAPRVEFVLDYAKATYLPCRLRRCASALALATQFT